MKFNSEFVMRKIAGDVVIVPTGESGQYFNGLITLNGVGTFIWENAQKLETREEIVQKLLEFYEIDEETARTDVNGFLDMLKSKNILLEE